jgi:peptidylprolyl isomerase
MRPLPLLVAALPALLLAAPPELAIPPADAPRTGSGLAFRIIQAGQPAPPAGPKAFVRAHFMGWDREGQTFANSRAQDEAPYLSLEKLMPGMRESLLAMGLGEQRRVWIPEALAFAGAKGRPTGGVVMDLELLDMLPHPEQAPPDVAAPAGDAQVLRSGLACKVLRAGTGTHRPTRASWVSVHYSGWTTDGKLFDSSIPKGTSVLLQLSNTIPGWIEGLQHMTVGEKRRFWIPEKLAYRGARDRPAGMLVFDVELVGMNP